MPFWPFFVWRAPLLPQCQSSAPKSPAPGAASPGHSLCPALSTHNQPRRAQTGSTAGPPGHLGEDRAKGRENKGAQNSWRSNKHPQGHTESGYSHSFSEGFHPYAMQNGHRVLLKILQLHRNLPLTTLYRSVKEADNKALILYGQSSPKK